MAVQTTLVNKPLNPRGNDQSPLAYNRAKLFSGKALSFDGVNDSIDISNFSLNGYTAFSVCFYKTSDFNNGMIFSSADSISDGVNIYQISPGYFRARLNGVNAADTTLKVSDKDGFFVFTYDGTNAKWYYQAQNIDSGTTSQTFAITNTTSTIGRQSFASVQYLSCDIAGFKIFNTALTAAQVADLYNNPEKVVPTGVDNTALKLWLPMQEGAGTTAYDGSGNGNHGTISGATWTHGIGAPVSQTAVIDWNKGTNILDNSENFDAWLKNAGNTITSDSIAAPDGLTTADTISSPVSSQINQHQVLSPVTSGANYVFSVWLKKKASSEIQIYQYSTATPIGFVSRATINFDSGTITDVEGSGATIEEYTNGWFRCAIYCTAPSTSLSHGIYTDSAGVADVYAWGGQSEQSDTLGPYVRTGATAQTSEVLLPQGLTTGRDITGVNLFENVRKQGALNLDGNSWAEVHDNASLDITDAITLEAWVYWDGSSAKGLLGRWKGAGSLKSYLLFANTSTAVQFLISNNGSTNYFVSTSTSISNGWNHIVGTADGSKVKVYLNGAFENEAAAAVSIYATSLPVEIGRLSDDSTAAYPNDIAQPRIYNRALTAEEVQRNYNAGKNIYTNS